MNNASLKSKTKKGFFWVTIERISTQGIQFLFTIILARILSPELYGIIAMPLIFLAIAQVFVDSGFTNALIRKPDLKEEDLSTAFFFNVFVGIICYAILFVTSPLIADFYNTPILASVLKVTALATLLNPLCAIQQTVLTIRMDFKLQSYVTAISSILAGLLGLYMAKNGYGVWSLVAQQVSATFLRMVALWTFSKWKPVLLWSKESFKYLWNFGSKIIAVGLLDTFYNNIYTLIIGKIYTPTDLGNYTRASHFADLPITNINSIMQRVTLPVLSKIQDEDNRLHDVYMKLLQVTSMSVFPIMIGAASIVSPVVLLILGDKWMDCILLLQILCIAKIWTPLNVVNVNLLLVKGRSDLFLKVEVIKKIILTIAILLTFRWGVIPMLLGYGVAIFIVFLLNTYYTKILIEITLTDQFKMALKYLFFSLVMFGVSWLVQDYFSSLLLKSIVGGFSCMLTYMLLLLLFDKKGVNTFYELVIKKGK